MPGVVALLCLIVAIGGLLFVTLRPDPEVKPQAGVSARIAWNTEELTATDPRFLRPVSESEARSINAALPVSGLPVQPSAPLVIPPALGTNWQRSVQCLTQAIYYEAATEPDDGKRAVAQVILNRVRHPAFPKSVCGVVYEGSTRTTGCQFSFTCDGSLARTPMASFWTRARQLAVAAISGQVYAPVGLSTFYHADYVAPYWAPSLTKVTAIGRHIFYRWNGRQGESGEFSGRYAGAEPDVALLMAAAYHGAAAPELAADMTEAVAHPTARPILSNNAVPLDAASHGEAAAGPTLSAGPRWVLGMGAPGQGPSAPEARSNRLADAHAEQPVERGQPR